MIIKKLDWDSKFFGMEIAKAVVDSQKDYSSLCRMDLSQWDLLYIFCQSRIKVDCDEFVLVDQKVLFEKSILDRSFNCPGIVVYDQQIPTDRLYNLALQSGLYSRFKLDNNFPKGSFERLYRRWIEQSVNGAIADRVFCHISNKEMDGMITLQVDGSCGQIGLVAVDESSRGAGIGSFLLQAVEGYLLEQGVHQLEVATQLTNDVACKYYMKNGFHQKSLTSIYHWWNPSLLRNK